MEAGAFSGAGRFIFKRKMVIRIKIAFINRDQK
jgi:hypothetical protein